MKRNNLPKGVVITGALLSTILMTTGCSTLKEVIDEYNPLTQQEMTVYGMAELADDTETPETEQEEAEGATEETTEVTEEDNDTLGEPVCVYGPAE